MKKYNNYIGFGLIILLMAWFMNIQEAEYKKAAEQRKKATTDSLAQVALQQKAAPTQVAQVTPTQAVANPSTVPVVAGAVVAAPNANDSATLLAAPVAIAEKKVVIETDRFWLTLDNRGARVSSIVLKDLKNHQGQFPELLQQPELGLLTFELDKRDFSQEMFRFDSNTPDTIHVNAEAQVKLSWTQGTQNLSRTFVFSKSGNDVRQSLAFSGWKPETYGIHFGAGLKETENVAKSQSIVGSYDFSEVIFNNSYNVVREAPTEKMSYNKEDGVVTWVGLRRQYVAALINFDSAVTARINSVPMLNPKNPGEKPTYSLRMTNEFAGETSLDFRLVVFPLVHSEIKKYNQSYEKILFSGWEWIGADKWFVALCGYILGLLKWFYSLIPNWGVAIILLTLLVKGATLPLTLKQISSMRKLQVHQPHLAAIKDKYRTDPRKMQTETMAYYKNAGINPFGPIAGCLPMILQMPIFIGLFVVLGRALELRGAPFFGWITDLSAPDVFTTAISIPLVMPMGLTILPILMAITTFYQAKQTATDPNMKPLPYIMTIMMFVFSGTMPSGLLIYWTVSNTFSIIQYFFTGAPNANPVQVRGIPLKKK
jgi:YidC/Oxa1 family membrane protein insertase